MAFEGVEIYDGWEQDGRAFGYNTQKQIVGATGGLTGAIIGAKIGALIGIWLFGIGSVPAAIIGGFIGGISGGFLSEKSSEYGYEKMNEILKR